MLNGPGEYLIFLNERNKKIFKMKKAESSTSYQDFKILKNNRIMVLDRNANLTLYQNFQVKSVLNVLEGIDRVDEITQNMAINQDKTKILVHSTALDRASKMILCRVNSEKNLIERLSYIDLFEENLRNFYALEFYGNKLSLGEKKIELVVGLSYSSCKAEFLVFRVKGKKIREEKEMRREMDLSYVRKLERVGNFLRCVDSESKLLEIEFLQSHADKE